MSCMSIITNFGCHYKCPYCIVKKNNLCIPKTTIAGLGKLKEVLGDYGCDTISISGGGDPLYEYEKHRDWYQELFSIAVQTNSSVEMHTSYMTDATAFPFQRCHLNSVATLERKTGRCPLLVGQFVLQTEHEW